MTERAVKVRVIKVSKLTILPRSLGYGSTRPGRSWDAVAEVSGQVAWVADELEDGKLVEPQEDKKSKKQLIKEATGKEPTMGPKQ